MKPVRLLALLPLLLLSLFNPSWSNSSESGEQPPDATVRSEFSADDFDLREIIPYLFMATSLPGEQGIKAVLENSKVLRAYVADEVNEDCRREKNRCAAKTVGEEEVSKRIDEIVREGIFHRHKTAILDYPLARQPFPFSELAAVKSDNHPDAYFMLSLADRSYTAMQVQAKYGTPYDTNIVQWYSVYIYRLDGSNYTSKAVFEIDPVDGAVIKVAISLKPKKPKKQR
jgi:hypothetical protein